MAIRPRVNSVWHDYRRVFNDLRSGRLSMIEYTTMVDEDALEASRRRLDVVGKAAVASLQKEEAKRKYDSGKDAATPSAPDKFADRMA